MPVSYFKNFKINSVDEDNYNAHYTVGHVKKLLLNTVVARCGDGGAIMENQGFSILYQYINNTTIVIKHFKTDFTLLILKQIFC